MVRILEGRLSTAELKVIIPIALIQFVNVLDFMLVIVLGPDIVRGLNIPANQLGWLTGSYSLAAFVVALIGGALLDHFERKLALIIFFVGLNFSTLSAVFANDIEHLLVARVMAGLFGGPTASLAMSLLIDNIPVSKRGKAMALVMSSVSVASIIGVPIALEFTWQVSFFGLGCLGLVFALPALFLLPRSNLHLRKKQRGINFPQILQQPIFFNAFAVTFCSLFSAFLLIPHLSTYYQFNLTYPRNDLGLLYMTGGACSLVLIQLAGRFVDRWGSLPVVFLSLGVWVPCVTYIFVFQGWMPVLAIMVLFMVGNSTRNIAIQTLQTRVPTSAQRAGFLSLQSGVRHVATAGAATLSTAMLRQNEKMALVGFDRVATLALFFVALVPLLIWILERRLLQQKH